MFGNDDLPAVAQLNPYLLGATSSAYGNAQSQNQDAYVRRTANQLDARLTEALSADQLVIVVGPSKAGKTRTLFEAIRNNNPAAKVLWPVNDGVVEVATHPRIADTDDPIVVWLDDLDEYLNATTPLTTALLARLSARAGRTTVVATLRSEKRDQLRIAGELQRGTRLLLDQALTIDLNHTSENPDEQAEAANTYPDETFGHHGLGEILAGARDLLQRYDDAKVRDPLQYIVTQVAVDWARIGRPGPIPEPTLAELTVENLRLTRPDIDITSVNVRAAIAAVRTPPEGAGRAAALSTSYLDERTRGYRPFDYLVAADDGQDHRDPRPVPETFWADATRDADARTLNIVAIVASQRGTWSEAITLLSRAYMANDVDAMVMLGLLMLTAKEATAEAAEGAEALFREAAAAGHPEAKVQLGSLLLERGDVAEAESLLREAADSGQPDARFMLRSVSPDGGQAHARAQLGALLLERGDFAGAERLLRESAAAGHLDAKLHLGALLLERGDIAAAEPLLREVAASGEPAAMARLALLIVEREGSGENEPIPEEAGLWLRRALKGRGALKPDL
ncbi:tetratricopeptide repeat protein [Kribbella sp. NPDC059898]|uniref:tetratricopeptide repeat protein n=1 Tax=Kribbella sp. NPDC059898 TaxID=3346995 RepID=UPI003665568E